MGVLAPGAEVVARYRLDRLLGEGGMGQVWAATHLITRKVVALKALKLERGGRADLVERFFREARAATAVGHPNVVQVHDVFVHEGTPVMVMELLQGEALAEKLDREGVLGLETLADIMVPIVSAIGTAHARGIVHRDLKPENVFLVRGPTGQIEPKVLDFGIAKLSGPEGAAPESAALTRTGSMLGTPFYMAPEQAAGERTLDHRCDIWALGVICYECLSGKRPFEGENFGQVFKGIIAREPVALSELRPDLPHAVLGLLARMLHKDPQARCELSEVLQTLSAYSRSSAPAFGTPLSEASSLPVLTDSLRAATHAGQETLEEGATFVDDAMHSARRGEQTMLATLDAASVERPRRLSTASRVSWRFGLFALLTALIATAFGVNQVLRRPSETAAGGPLAASAVTEAQPVGTTRRVDEPPLLEQVQGTGSTDVTSARPAAAPPLPSASAAIGKPRHAQHKPVGAPSVSAARKLPGGILDQGQAPF